MIKLSEILVTNKLVSISDKGISDMEKVQQLLNSLTYFKIDHGVVYENNSSKFHLASDLGIWVDESIIKPGEKVPLTVLFQRIQSKLGSFDGMDDFKSYIEDLAKEGLIKY